MRDNMFEQLDFGAFKEYIDDDDITDISYTNNGQIWLRSLQKGSFRVDNPKIDNSVVEKLAFQCSNVMGTTFNNASPFLDAESPELRMNFVHESIATNGIALVIRKTPAKIRLKEDNLLQEDYVTKDMHDFLIKCVLGHCNIIVCGETGSGKTEFVKYLASHTKEDEKIITIEDTLELHLDRIYPHRDIVSMKTNNIASYSDVLVTCMRQNPKWILLSEVRSAEAVSAVRNSISSGHNILSTIHSDKASAVPHRMYSLMETDLDVDQFLNTIYRYVQLAVHIKAYFSPSRGKFHREIDEITEFYIDEETNEPVYNILYQKTMTGKVIKKKPSKHLMDYLLGQNIDVKDTAFSNEVDSENSSTLPKEEFDLDKLVEDDQNTVDANVVNDVSGEVPSSTDISNIQSQMVADNEAPLPIVDVPSIQPQMVENNELEEPMLSSVVAPSTADINEDNLPGVEINQSVNNEVPLPIVDSPSVQPQVVETNEPEEPILSSGIVQNTIDARENILPNAEMNQTANNEVPLPIVDSPNIQPQMVENSEPEVPVLPSGIITTNTIDTKENILPDVEMNQIVNNEVPLPIVDAPSIQPQVVENSEPGVPVLPSGIVPNTINTRENILPGGEVNQTVNNEVPLPMVDTPNIQPQVVGNNEPEEPILPSVAIPDSNQINQANPINNVMTGPVMSEPILPNPGVVSDAMQSSEKSKFFPFSFFGNEQSNS